jgi:hypothetical protein
LERNQESLVRELAKKDEKILELHRMNFQGKNDSIVDHYQLKKTFSTKKTRVALNPVNIFETKRDSLETSTTCYALRDITNTETARNSIQKLRASIIKKKGPSSVQRFFDAKKMSSQSDFKYKSHNSSGVRNSWNGRSITPKNGLKKCASVNNLSSTTVDSGHRLRLDLGTKKANFVVGDFCMSLRR